MFFITERLNNDWLDINAINSLDFNVKKNKGNLTSFEKQQLLIDGAKVHTVAEYTQTNSFSQTDATVSQHGQRTETTNNHYPADSWYNQVCNDSYLLCQHCDALLSIPSILTKHNLSINSCEELYHIMSVTVPRWFLCSFWTMASINFACIKVPVWRHDWFVPL